MNDQYRRRLTTARKTPTPIRLALAVTLALAGWGSAALATNDPIPGVPDYGQSVTSTASVSAGAPSANGIAGGPIPGPSQPAGVVFTSENWNAPQTGRTPPASADGAGKPSGIVAVTVVDDPSAVGDRAALPPKGGDNKTPPGIAPRKAGGHDPTQEYSSAPIPNNENVKAAIVRNPEPFNNPKNDSANSDGSLSIFDRWGNLPTDTSVEPAGPPSTINTSRSNIKHPTKVDAGGLKSDGTDPPPKEDGDDPAPMAGEPIPDGYPFPVPGKPGGSTGEPTKKAPTARTAPNPDSGAESLRGGTITGSVTVSGTGVAGISGFPADATFPSTYENAQSDNDQKNSDPPVAGFGTGMNGSPGVGPAMDGMGGMNPMMGPGGRANPMIGPGGAAGPGNPMIGGGAMGGRP